MTAAALLRRLNRLESRYASPGTMRALIDSLSYGAKVAALAAVRERDTAKPGSILDEEGFTMDDVFQRLERHAA